MKHPRKPLAFSLDLAPVTENEIARVEATVPKPPPIARQQLGARIPVNIYRELRVRAVMEGVLVQDLIEQAIVEFLARGK